MNKMKNIHYIGFAVSILSASGLIYFYLNSEKKTLKKPTDDKEKVEEVGEAKSDEEL